MSKSSKSSKSSSSSTVLYGWIVALIALIIVVKLYEYFTSKPAVQKEVLVKVEETPKPIVVVIDKSGDAKVVKDAKVIKEKYYM